MSNEYGMYRTKLIRHPNWSTKFICGLIILILKRSICYTRQITIWEKGKVHNSQSVCGAKLSRSWFISWLPQLCNTCRRQHCFILLVLYTHKHCLSLIFIRTLWMLLYQQSLFWYLIYPKRCLVREREREKDGEKEIWKEGERIREFISKVCKLCPTEEVYNQSVAYSSVLVLSQVE